jgi:hypothetical protein
MAALPKIVEEIVSGVLVVFEFFHFMWALLMEVVSMFCHDMCRGVREEPIRRHMGCSPPASVIP